MSVFRPTTFLILCTAIFLLCTSCNDQKIISVKPSVIPNPEQLTTADGHFVWDDDVFLEVDDSLQPAAELLTLYTEKSTGKYASQGSKKISLKLDSSIANNEGYKLVVSPESIQLTSSSLAGAFRGVQTIRQLLPPCIENGSCDGKISIPSVTVVDAPKFIYRGLHLDVGRHFFPVDFVKKYIDMIALMKMNTFHWHLTEDQGWRIEIKKYPRLTSHGAYRKETIIGHNNDEPQQFDGKRYGGFYTQDEIKEVVQYATERGITIIPEIEMPGHSQAAISAYPELGCTGDSIDVATKWGVFEDIYCPKEETFAFLEDVLDEVMALFPSEYIHIGGDEAPKKRWKECKYCQELIKREGLKDEHGLQSYFIHRIEKYLNSKGRQIIGWDEILEGGLAPNATVMSWRGTGGAVEAARQHHDVILTPGSHCYFDHYQSENKDEPLAIGGYLPLEKVYDFNPVPAELTEEEAAYVLGAQGNLWTEYITTPEYAEYMAFPRAIALSEVLWTGTETKDYDAFLSRLTEFKKRMDAMGIHYSDHVDRYVPETLKPAK